MRGKGGEKLTALFPNMLLIGSTGRNSGKTVLACSLIRRFSRQTRVIGLKVTTIHGAGTTCPRGGEGCGVCSSLDGDFCVTKETDSNTEKDTAKMLESGAVEVFWLRVRAGCMEAAVTALGELLPPDTPVIAESNTLRRFVTPGVFFIVKPECSGEVKPSAKRVLGYADRVIQGNRERTNIDTDEITFTRGRFLLRRDATLVLLAGGGSRRMGASKSLLEYRGMPLIVYIYNQLAPLFKEVIVSVSTEETIPAELAQAKVVVDRIPGRGPISGIAAGLGGGALDKVFLNALGIPAIHPGLIARMLDHAQSCDVVVPRTREGYIEPLHAVYRRTLLPEVLKLIESGEKRIRQLYGSVKTCYEDLGVNQELTNINTPEEYKEILTTHRAAAPVESPTVTMRFDEWSGSGEGRSGSKAKNE